MKKLKFSAGAIGMVDALGFRGVWGNAKKPDLGVLRTLSLVRSELEAHSEQLKERLGRGRGAKRVGFAPSVEVHFLSDTVVLAASLRSHRLAAEAEGINAILRLAVSKSIARLMRAAALGPRPLAYRGVISVGLFAIDYPFLVGPAVDEAASLMDQADGAFVWLAPSANTERAIYGSLVNDKAPIEVPWVVPLKSGAGYATRCVNPGAGCDSVDEAGAVRSSIIKSMNSPRLEVCGFRPSWTAVSAHRDHSFRSS